MLIIINERNAAEMHGNSVKCFCKPVLGYDTSIFDLGSKGTVSATISESHIDFTWYLNIKAPSNYRVNYKIIKIK